MILFSWLFDRHKLSVIFITWIHSFSVIFFTSSSGSLRWLCSNSKLEYFNSCSFGGLYSLADQGKLLYKPERICELPLLIKNTLKAPSRATCTRNFLGNDDFYEISLVCRESPRKRRIIFQIMEDRNFKINTA